MAASGKGERLKINVSKIPEGGMDIRFEREGSWFRGYLPEAAPTDWVPDRIDVACSVSRMKENVFIEGTAATTVEAPCGRCLEMTRQPVNASFRYTFTPPPDQSKEEWELTAEDLDFAYYEEDIIDLDALVFEQVMLHMPIKPLCAESCKGLCPRCGIDLNKATCRCQAETFDERLAALKRFKVQPEK